MGSSISSKRETFSLTEDEFEDISKFPNSGMKDSAIGYVRMCEEEQQEQQEQQEEQEQEQEQDEEEQQ